MLPQAHNPPASGLQRSICGSVSLDVPAQLGRPVPLVAGRLTPMLGTYMPETPVHEHSDLAGSEDYVRPYTHATGQVQPEVLPVSVTQRMQSATESNFWFRVSTTVRAHVARATFVRRPRVASCSPRLLPSSLPFITGHCLAATHSNRSAVRCMSEDTAYDMVPAGHNNNTRRPTWRILK